MTAPHDPDVKAYADAATRLRSAGDNDAADMLEYAAGYVEGIAETVAALLAERDALRERAESAERDAAELLTALRKHGRHTSDCFLFKYINDGVCNCGLRAALAAQSAGESAKT